MKAKLLTSKRSCGVFFLCSLMALLTVSAIQLNPEKTYSEVCFEPKDMAETIQVNVEQSLFNTKRILPFCIDKYEVTVGQFKRFVEETGYKTTAETGPSRDDYPEQVEAFYTPGSAVFVFPSDEAPGGWQFNVNANWAKPKGLDIPIDDIAAHPVTHISYKDATAYANWLGRRLPTEQEWEFAASTNQFQFDPSDEQVFANIWTGIFPFENNRKDGFITTAPVGSYPPDTHGLYDMIGNVWEWTSDRYGSLEANKRVIKGGSHLCAFNHCANYTKRARQPQDVGFSASHLGFRTVKQNIN